NLSALSGRIGDTPLVQHLAQEVERLTQVPVKGQKLIHKGKSDQTKEISSLGLQNESKIMVIGKRFDNEEDEMMMRMHVIEKDVNTQFNKLTQIHSQMQGISNVS
uniref:Ubiquitin-like domain-containing protein n=1 Tax=Capitella teleta TaxID=283909 RepID=X1Z3Y4_CAPTE